MTSADEPSFREKLFDFASAIILVALTMFTGWHYSLPMSRGLASDQSSETSLPALDRNAAGSNASAPLDTDPGLPPRPARPPARTGP
jgi:hypothetical protein